MTGSKALQAILGVIEDGLRVEPDGTIVYPSGYISQTKAIGHDGYVRIRIFGRGVWATVMRSRLVCFAVHGPPSDPSLVADHINRNRKDDRPENLRWITHDENCLNVDEEVREKRKSRGISSMSFGEQHRHAKLSPDYVREIRRLVASGLSRSAVAKKYDVHPSQIARIVRGETWRHVSDEENEAMSELNQTCIEG